jgi:uncharacterized protein YjbJ (UPF0337 family)
MGIMDKIKGLVSGNADKAKDGVDTATDAVKSKTPDQVDGAVDQAADKAKDVIDGM